MKPIRFKTLWAIALALAFSLSAKGQTNGEPSSFFGSVQLYLTSFNTNLDSTFGATNYRGSVLVGADYVQGVNISSSLGLSYDIGKSSWSAESMTRNAGIAGTILSQQAGIGYNIVVHDTKLTGFLEGGYDFQQDKPYAAVGARILKALTTHTFAGTGLEVHINNHLSTPVVTLFTGFTF